MINMKMPTIIELASSLISKKSITPDDQGCQVILGNLLKQAGFTVIELNFNDTHNLWATHTGNPGKPEPMICLAGHTDVVPTGDLSKWDHDPFDPIIKNDFLYGRGAADMKASLAVQVISAIEFVKNNPNHTGTLAFLITSDTNIPPLFFASAQKSDPLSKGVKDELSFNAPFDRGPRVSGFSQNTSGGMFLTWLYLIEIML
jgi:acetylornithine deacetylase/succinyl-diaminopimelate desuccinylase-like protein